MTTTLPQPTTTTHPTPAELGITQTQYDNFVKTRDYLRNADIPFTMNAWCHCTVGHASGILHSPRMDGESWNAVARRLFGYGGGEDDNSTFLFLFGTSWAYTNDPTHNTPAAAADRIDAFLAGECKTN